MSQLTVKILNNEFSVIRPSRYNGLYGKAPPERGTFFRMEVYKGQGFHKLTYRKGSGKLSFTKVLKDPFQISRNKGTVMQVWQIGLGVPFFYGRYMKRVIFSVKNGT